MPLLFQNIRIGGKSRWKLSAFVDARQTKGCEDGRGALICQYPTDTVRSTAELGFFKDRFHYYVYNHTMIRYAGLHQNKNLIIQVINKMV